MGQPLFRGGVSIPVSSAEWKRLAIYSALAMEMALSVAAGTVIGYLVDRLFHTTPIFMVVGLFVGCVGAVVNFIKLWNFLKSKIKIE